MMSFACFDEIYWICCELAEPPKESFPLLEHPVITDPGRLAITERKVRIPRKRKNGLPILAAAKDNRMMIL